MASRNYLLTLRFLCVFVSPRLRIITAKAQGRKDFAKGPKEYLVKVFHAILLSQPLIDVKEINLQKRNE